VPTHVALLRGINVGGRSRVAMADLRDIVSSLGHTDVATYVQSGNVVFSTEKRDTRTLAAELERAIAERLDVAPTSVEAITLGSHGDQMVALPRHARVEGKPLPELVDDPTLEALFSRTRDAGAEIVGYLKKGSAFYAPSSSAVAMVAAIAGDTKEVLPTCAWTTGQYGVSDVYLGVPARLGRSGVEEIVELDLNADERAALADAAEAIRAKCEELRARRSS
jgi:malate dehydrogenase